MKYPKFGLWKSLLVFLALSVLDVVNTSYFLARGGIEANIIIRTLISQGFAVWEAKIALITPLAVAWMKLYSDDEKKAETMVDFANWFMTAIVIFQFLGYIFANT